MEKNIPERETLNLLEDITIMRVGFARISRSLLTASDLAKAFSCMARLAVPFSDEDLKPKSDRL